MESRSRTFQNEFSIQQSLLTSIGTESAFLQMTKTSFATSCTRENAYCGQQSYLIFTPTTHFYHERPDFQNLMALLLRRCWNYYTWKSRLNSNVIENHIFKRLFENSKPVECSTMVDSSGNSTDRSLALDLAVTSKRHFSRKRSPVWLWMRGPSLQSHVYYTQEEIISPNFWAQKTGRKAGPLNPISRPMNWICKILISSGFLEI